MKYIVEESGPRFVTCRRIVEASDEIAALNAFNRGEGDKVEGYPEIGRYIDRGEMVGIERHIVSEAADTAPVHLTSRELSLIRAACVGRLDRHARASDPTGYDEIKNLLDGKLRTARRDHAWKGKR
jgi:hypothetical protein